MAAFGVSRRTCRVGKKQRNLTTRAGSINAGRIGDGMRFFSKKSTLSAGRDGNGIVLVGVCVCVYAGQRWCDSAAVESQVVSCDQVCCNAFEALSSIFGAALSSPYVVATRTAIRDPRLFRGKERVTQRRYAYGKQCKHSDPVLPSSRIVNHECTCRE